MLDFKVIGSGYRRVQQFFLLPSRVKEAFKEASDINNIMKRYDRTAIIDHFSRHQGQYGDFDSPYDYQESLNRIKEADDSFMSLPASLRKRFDNDPGAFLDFIHNPANVKEATDLGLFKPVSEVVVPSPASSTEA